MTLVLALLVLAVAAALAARALSEPAQRRHRRAVVRRVWDREGLGAAYRFALERGWWKVAGELRREVVRADPIGTPEITEGYVALHRRAREETRA